MSARGGPDDDYDGGWHTNQRTRSTSLIRWFAVFLVAAGIVALVSVVLNGYAPDLADPTRVDPVPLFGLVNLAASGVVAILFGLLIYLYATLAGV